MRPGEEARPGLGLKLSEVAVRPVALWVEDGLAWKEGVSGARASHFLI